MSAVLVKAEPASLLLTASRLPSRAQERAASTNACFLHRNVHPWMQLERVKRTSMLSLLHHHPLLFDTHCPHLEYMGSLVPYLDWENKKLTLDQRMIIVFALENYIHEMCETVAQ